jgi:hypothetical protein
MNSINFATGLVLTLLLQNVDLRESQKLPQAVLFIKIQ